AAAAPPHAAAGAAGRPAVIASAATADPPMTASSHDSRPGRPSLATISPTTPASASAHAAIDRAAGRGPPPAASHPPTPAHASAPAKAAAAGARRSRRTASATHATAPQISAAPAAQSMNIAADRAGSEGPRPPPLDDRTIASPGSDEAALGGAA